MGSRSSIASETGSAKFGGWRFWFLKVFFPSIYDRFVSAVVARDVALSAYIRCERVLAKYRPTMPVNISDREIERRLS